MYRIGVPLVEIARVLDRHRVTIGEYLKSEGIDTRARRQSKYTVNEEFFRDFSTPEKAYWLGFLLADGCCGARTVQCGLQTSDRDHLEKLSEALGYDGPISDVIRTTRGEKHELSLLYVASVRLRRSLMDAGWDDFKKRGDVRIVESVPDGVRAHLLRGLFDGDGSLFSHDGQMYFKFIDAHESVVTWYRDELRKRLGLSAVKVNPSCHRRTSFVFHYGGNVQVRKIMDVLYEGSEVYLDRKRARYSELRAASAG